LKINYHGKKFTAVSNSPNGQVNSETLFHYYQHDNVLSGEYSGGEIKTGSLLGQVNEDNSLFFVYHHIDIHGNLKSGFCHSMPSIMDNQKVRLHEKWEWTFGGEGSGESVVEEL
jgi:hypothetical protein